MTGNKPQPRRSGLAFPIRMAHEGDLMPARDQTASQREKGVEIAVGTPRRQEPAHAVELSGGAGASLG